MRQASLVSNFDASKFQTDLNEVLKTIAECGWQLIGVEFRPIATSVHVQFTALVTFIQF